MRILVAGATGVIGRRLVPMLTNDGHEVWATTRSPGRAERIVGPNVHAVVVDVFDLRGLRGAVGDARPDVVIDQLTDLAVPDPSMLDAAALGRNARLRDEGTSNLIEAAVAAGATRLIAQSVAWLSAPGPEPHDEGDPLLDASGPSATTIAGVLSLERQVLSDPRFEGLVLRYGRLYGPGTWTEAPTEPPTVHVDDAARAAALAVSRGAAGVYAIVDDGGPVSNRKAGRDLGWRPRRRGYAG